MHTPSSIQTLLPLLFSMRNTTFPQAPEKKKMKYLINRSKKQKSPKIKFTFYFSTFNTLKASQD